MQAAARLAGRAVPAVAAGVATVVSSGTALADAPALVALQARPRILDEWELVNQDGKSVALFSAGDIDNAVGLLTRCVAAPPAQHRAQTAALLLPAGTQASNPQDPTPQAS